MAEWLQVCEGSPRHRYTPEGLVEREGTGVVRAPGKRALVQKVITDYGGLIRTLAPRYGIPEAWVAGLIAFESGGNPGAASPGVGARGLMQIMPSTAEGLGRDPERLWEPAYNIETGLLYLQRSVARYGLDLPVLAGAYNAGSKRCAVTTNCKTRGVSDGTTATNSWGLIEDCSQGTSSRYVEVIVGAANEAVLLGMAGKGGVSSGAAQDVVDAIKQALVIFVPATLVGAVVFLYARDL